MTTNPVYNALLASGYIIVIALFFRTAETLLAGVEDNILMPITMLSLVVLSVSFMATVFFLKPVQMYLDGQKKEAVALFLRTVGTFAVITLVFIVLVFAVSLVIL